MATLHKTLTRNTTTDITVGNPVTDGCVIIRYSCTRGVLSNAGIIVVINKAIPPKPYHVFFFIEPENEVGITDVAASIVGTSLILTLTVDNSVASDVVFNYSKTPIKL